MILFYKLHSIFIAKHLIWCVQSDIFDAGPSVSLDTIHGFLYFYYVYFALNQTLMAYYYSMVTHLSDSRGCREQLIVMYPNDRGGVGTSLVVQLFQYLA